MAATYDIVLYHVTYLDTTFGLRTLTFNHQETANDFCNQLLVEQCEFVHFYSAKTSTIFLKDESMLYVP